MVNGRRRQGRARLAETQGRRNRRARTLEDRRARTLEGRRARTGRVSTTHRRQTAVRVRSAAARPHPRFGWYAGVTIMAIVEIIEWPLAIVMMVGHEIAHHAHNRALRDFAEGVEAGA